MEDPTPAGREPGADRTSRRLRRVSGKRFGLAGSVAALRAHRPSFQFLAGIALLVAIAVLPAVALCFWAMREFDAIAEGRDRTLIERAIAEKIADVAQEQESVTVWDSAVLRTRARDAVWMDENVGVWLHEFYGHDQIFVLDAQDHPIHAVIGDRTLEAGAFDPVRAAVLPLVQDLRRQIAATDAPEGLGVQDLRRIDGRPAIVSVKPIVPSTALLSFRPEATYVHVSIIHLDGAILSRIGARNLISGLRFVPAPATPHVPGGVEIRSVRDGLLGHVAWTPTRPGQAAIRAILPGVALSLLALLGVVVWLTRRLARAFLLIRSNRAQVQHLAFHDTLTGLPNRILFNDRLDQALALVRRGEASVALHYIDLDRFKNVNDTLGHPAGDELIRQVANRLKSITREADTVARLGGDEFVILQTSVRDWSSAERLAERSLEVLQQPYSLFSDQAFVGASIGIALAPESATERDELTRKADIALYQAKSGGRGRVCLFQDVFDEVVRRKRTVERDLRAALQGGEGLSLVYQPFYAPDGVTIHGAEALFRWRHPIHGALSPLALIAIAEERGLVRELGEWILREACRTARQVGLPFLSINVSPLQFQDSGFGELVLAVVRETGYPAGQLQLEIKESILFENGEAIAPMLDMLRSAGIRVALDDFGSGFSTFRSLHRFRVDGIKIDRSFVQNIGRDTGTDAMVQVMFDLARAFGIGIVAEGVETEDQWKQLVQLGAPELQGFLFSRPVGAAELEQLVERSGESAQLA